MKKSLLATMVAVGLMMTLTLKSRAADEKTVTGQGKCAKCARVCVKTFCGF